MSLNKFNSIKKGFTVLELLVVIAIIGILAGVIMASMADARAKARDAKRIEEMHSIQTALTLYYDKYGYYPYYDVALNGGLDSNLKMLVTEGFLPSIPTDLLGGNSVYHYTGLSVTAQAFPTSPTSPSAYPQYLPLCNGYHLAVSLERNNAILNSDSDYSSVGMQMGNRCGSPQSLVSNNWPYVADGNDGPNAGGCTHNLSSTSTEDAGTYCYDIMKQN